VGPEWEDQYRWAKAYESVAADVVNFVVGLKNQLSTLIEKEKEKETSIEDA
jgi:predicted glycosyl hydrolase (DUF1957 family)